jgi:hypothetical protein
MASTIYCVYCHHNWKPGIEYDKHLRCCEYFYKKRRTPPQTEMTESGVPVPNLRQMYRYIQDLTYRLEKTEKELKKLKTIVNSRRRIEVLVWLNQPNQTPSITFENWVRSIKSTESDMIKVLNNNMSDGILSSLYSAIQCKDEINLPIRCFIQKPGTIYVYSYNEITSKNEWQIMKSELILKLINHIAKSIRKEFQIWNTAQICNGVCIDDQTFMDKLPKYVKKLNCDTEKYIPEIKKELFSKLAEKFAISEPDFDEN